jgi:hypothetical protein
LWSAAPSLPRRWRRRGAAGARYRRGRKDHRIGLLFPPGSALADEADVIVASPSRYAGRLTLAAARAEMDLLEHRFLYFLDAGDGRGRVVYLRTDGDYGVVEPW